MRATIAPQGLQLAPQLLDLLLQAFQGWTL